MPEQQPVVCLASAPYHSMVIHGPPALVLAFLSQSAPTRCTLLWHFVSVIHSAFPAMVFTLLDLTAAFESPPFALSVLTHSMVCVPPLAFSVLEPKHEFYFRWDISKPSVWYTHWLGMCSTSTPLVAFLIFPFYIPIVFAAARIRCPRRIRCHLLAPR